MSPPRALSRSGGRPGSPAAAPRPRSRARLASPPAPGDALLAIDVGTSGARAAAFDLDGRRIVEARRSYATFSPQSGWAEQDGQAWRSAALSALAGAVRQLPAGWQVRAVGLTGQCPSFVPLDEHAAPVGMGLIYRDNRATAEAGAIRERFGDAALHRLTGHLPAAFHIAPKLLWLRAHRPEVFAATRTVAQPRDLVAHALTGEWATEGTHAAATLLFDLRARSWSSEMFEALGLDPAIVPPVRSALHVVGSVRPSVARRVGLGTDVPVILGGADSQACAFGAGVVASGPVSEMAGSSTCLNSVVAEPLDDLRITHYTHVLPEGFTTETGINTTGEAVRWAAELLYGGRSGRPGALDYLRLDHEAAGAPAGAGGLLALVALADGERDDPALRGAFTGLSLRHGRGELARAVLEGAAFAIRGQLELLRRAGGAVDELRVSGGDARLVAWNRIKADATGLPVVRIPGDAASTGVAMLAGLGAGVYRDVEEAMRRAVGVAERLDPDPDVRALYDERYEAWRRLAGSDVVRRGNG